jgi:nitrous oxide reductase accessory protein NosL
MKTILAFVVLLALLSLAFAGCLREEKREQCSPFSTICLAKVCNTCSYCVKSKWHIPGFGITPGTDMQPGQCSYINLQSLSTIQESSQCSSIWSMSDEESAVALAAVIAMSDDE